jgi:hypothetical protein
LRPHAEDYRRVLIDSVADRARATWDAIWDAAPSWPARPGGATDLHITAAPAEALEASPGFPGGYRLIAGLLRPGQIWMCWDVIAAGFTFDGLVRIGERWAWFPKPWRVLPVASPNGHWVE